jgi:type III pantothenate kinase
MKAEVNSNPYVVATGGVSTIIAPETESIDAVDKMLTLEGLRIIYLRNTQGSGLHS